MKIYNAFFMLLVLVNLAATSYLLALSGAMTPTRPVVAKTPAAEQCERMTALLNGGSPSQYEERCRKGL